VLLESCGRVKVNSKVRVDAKTYSCAIIRLDFIKEIKALCTDIYPEYENLEEAKRCKLQTHSTCCRF
jgi:hypothetical protein